MAKKRGKTAKSGSARRSKKSRLKNASAESAPPNHVTLRAGGAQIDVVVTPAQAMLWSKVVLNRRRWSGDEKAAAKQTQEAAKAVGVDVCEWLDSLGSEAFDGLVEVRIPYKSERDSWPARVFPWEYVLTAARRRGTTPMTVMRSIVTPARPPRRSTNNIVLYVESAPCGLRSEYGFENERRLVQHALQIDDAHLHSWREAPQTVKTDPNDGFTLVVLDDPDAGELEKALLALQPEIVHLTGFDTHQGLALLNDLSEAEPGSDSASGVGAGETTDKPAPDSGDDALYPESVKDGYLLRHGTRPFPLFAEDLARLLCVAGEKPRLVSFNFFNSGSRCAALAVAEGVGATIGFLDEFDDSLTERLFAECYTAWRLERRAASGALDGALSSFRWAFDQQRRYRGALRGTNVVFCLSGELLEERTATRRTRSWRDLSATVKEAHGNTIEVTEELDKILHFDIEHLRDINYSLLHNDQPLFLKFDIIKHHDGTLRNLEIEVLLYFGDNSVPFRQSLNLVERVTPLTREIRVPLTSALARAVRESVRTSLYVHASVGGRTLYRRTLPVSLLSANEWRDTDEDRIWLPSFVLPSDPAVSRIVDSAQRYLMAIADEPTMGFDGYQSLDENGEDPHDLIDAQVRALWSALLYEHPLGYINPPPTYTKSSQRIRTPSEVLDGRRGTCIDLALLLAACLEYVEIYPVIFLLEGHCFPGYWRNDADHDAFLLVKDSVESDAETGSEIGRREEIAEQQKQSKSKYGRYSHYGWFYDKPMYDDLKHWVRKGSLVPLESVWLTTRESFAASQEAGAENLRSKREFDSMLDVVRARSSAVTPLPVRGETQ